MTGPQRNPWDMKIDILRMLATKGCIQTKLIYGCNLNQTKGAAMIKTLLKKGSIGRNEDSSMYYLTDAGRKAILLYDELRGLI